MIQVSSSPRNPDISTLIWFDPQLKILKSIVVKRLWSQKNKNSLKNGREMYVRIYSLLVSVNQEAGWRNAQHDIDSFRIFGRVKIHAVHGQLFGVFEIMAVSFCWRLTPVNAKKLERSTIKVTTSHAFNKMWYIQSTVRSMIRFVIVIVNWHWRVCFVKLDDLVLQVCVLLGSKAYPLEVTRAPLLSVVVSELWLDEVRP